MRFAYTAITFVGLVIAFPLILWGLPFISDDGAWHYIYFRGFSDQLFSGELYPRWIAELNLGLGSPTFFFYPPVAYYITSLFRLIPVDAWHQLGLTMGLSIPASGLIAFAWMRKFTTEGASFLASILYMLLPYRMLDAFGRGAEAEALTFVWMPLVMLSIFRTVRGSKVAFFGMAMGFALMLGTHLPSTMIFAPVALGYAVIDPGDFSRTRALLITIAALLLGATISAAYLLPAIAMQNLVNFELMKQGLFSYDLYFVGPGLKVQGALRYFWLIVQPGLLLVLLLLSWRELKKPNRVILVFWMVVAFGSIFMMLWISVPIWQLLVPLQTLQFPWRFNLLLTLAVPPVFALAWPRIQDLSKWKRNLIMGYAVLLTAIWTIDVPSRIYGSYFKPQSEGRRLDERHRAVDLKADWKAFWPKTVPNEAGEDLEALVTNISAPNGVIPFARFASGEGSVEIAGQQPRRVQLAVMAKTTGKIEYSQFYFEGMKAEIAGESRQLNTTPSNLGLVNVDVPVGNYKLEITLAKTMPEIAGETISIISILLSGFAFGIVILRNRSKNHTSEVAVET